MSRVLIVAAHPDDEVLGCGGTIAGLAHKGHAVYIGIIGEGLTSRYKHRQHVDSALVKDLRDCSRHAAQLLGAEEIFHYNFPDNSFDTVPLLEVIKLVEKLIDNVQPHVVYTHHSGDLNIDHVITHRAVLTATRPSAGHRVNEIYAFEVPSSTEWAFGQFGTTFRPNIFVDISATIDTKIKAMQLYQSEVQPYPYPRSIENLQTIAHRWGSTVGLDAAEAFELIRAIRDRQN
jgi:LmbE family N-acetylglucosaminyl deacetylase